MIRITLADYANPVHATALVNLLDAYAQDPMGGGHPLSEYTKTRLVGSMAERPQIFSLLAFLGADDSTPVGLANCIEGFSTFACKPLVNVHDLAVLPAWRGQGIAEKLLNEVLHIAQQRGVCKLTLEVLSGNTNAVRLYTRLGFADYQLDPQAGSAQLMQKWLEKPSTQRAVVGYVQLQFLGSIDIGDLIEITYQRPSLFR